MNRATLRPIMATKFFVTTAQRPTQGAPVGVDTRANRTPPCRQRAAAGTTLPITGVAVSEDRRRDDDGNRQRDREFAEHPA